MRLLSRLASPSPSPAGSRPRAFPFTSTAAPFAALVFLAGIATLPACGSGPSPSRSEAAGAEDDAKSRARDSSFAEDARSSMGYSVAKDTDLFAESLGASPELLAEMKYQFLQTADLFGGVFREFDEEENPLLHWRSLTLVRGSERTQTYAGDGSVGFTIGSGQAQGEITQTSAAYSVTLTFKARSQIEGRRVLRYRARFPLTVSEKIRVTGNGEVGIVDEGEIPWLLRGPLKLLLGDINAKLKGSGDYEAKNNFAAELTDKPRRGTCTSVMAEYAESVLRPMCESVFATFNPEGAKACRVDACKGQKPRGFLRRGGT